MLKKRFSQMMLNKKKFLQIKKVRASEKNSAGLV